MPEHYPNVQRLHIPFTVHNRQPCTVDITVEPDSDPIRHGQHLLNIWPSPDLVLGYPVLEAVISSPESRTYGSLYGWVQFTVSPNDGWVVDLYPQFQNVNSPYAMWGAAPAFVDAPGQTQRKNLDWTARAFLCYSPDAAMTKNVVPILAFEWGYWVDDGKPFVKELQKMDIMEWNQHVKYLSERFNGWNFEPVKDS